MIMALKKTSVSTYISIHLSIYLYIYLYFYPYICPSIHLSIYLTTYLSIYLSIFIYNFYISSHELLSIHLKIYLSCFLYINISIYIFIHISIYLSLPIFPLKYQNDNGIEKKLVFQLEVYLLETIEQNIIGAPKIQNIILQYYTFLYNIPFSYCSSIFAIAKVIALFQS